MLFSEIYGCYFRVIEHILNKARTGKLTQQEIRDAVAEGAFGESALTIPSALVNGEWLLLHDDLGTPIKKEADMPLSALEKRWMKALLQDPRIRLFQPDERGLEEVEPLYTPHVFVYFDRYDDGDPYGEEEYVRVFRCILEGLRRKCKMKLAFNDGASIEHEWQCVPINLEYSSKDDKFRLIVCGTESELKTINVARIKECELLEPSEMTLPVASSLGDARKTVAELHLSDERNALERAMLHFSHFEKETERIEGNRYKIKIRYDADDEAEVLIRILSFGPMLHVMAPPALVDKIKMRLEMQKNCGLF